MNKIYLFLLIVLIGCQKDPVQYTLSVTANPQEGGLVNPTSGIYNQGESATIVAAANQYYSFKGWSGQWTGSSPTFTITMDSDKNIIGNFEKVDDDEDGILNQNDICANTPSGLSVDSSGCALSQRDTDGDGVTDDIDQCENTPFNSNLVSEVGCKIDLFYLSENGLTIKANELAQLECKRISMERPSCR